MMHIKKKSANDAWYSCLEQLFFSEEETGYDKYFRDSMVLIEVEQPYIEPIHPLFPMIQDDIDVINEFIYSGNNEGNVVHKWTKLYYHRMFDEPYSQVKFFIRELSKKEPSGRSQMSIWDKEIDQEAEIAPCTQIIWGRKKKGTLEFHVHAHSSDAYEKLLMNIQEFISLQHYIADKIGIKPGKYYHIIDSCHIKQKNKNFLSMNFQNQRSSI